MGYGVYEDRPARDLGALVQSAVITPSYAQQYIREGGKVLRRLVGPWEEVQ